MEKKILLQVLYCFFISLFINWISPLVNLISACAADYDLIIDINYYRNNNPIFNNNNVTAKINDLILMQAVIINNDSVDYGRLINLNHTWSIDFSIISTGSNPTFIYRPTHAGYITVAVMISGKMRLSSKSNKECPDNIEEFNGIAYDYLKVEANIDNIQLNNTGKRELSNSLLKKKKLEQTEWKFIRNKFIRSTSYSLAIFFLLIVIILFILAMIRYRRLYSTNINNEPGGFDRILLLDEF